MTHSRIYFASSENCSVLDDSSVDLVVTSPPYPMIEMWDESFSRWDPRIGDSLGREDGTAAFDLMHLKLDSVWNECARVLKPGAFACINIGDATRTVGARFRLYSNHARITDTFLRLGFDCLPVVLWRKQTNAPNKFMGSGMLPSGAYVTLEHEYILIFRKGGKRVFKESDKERRRQSAFFWEERNTWFSDIWDFKGTGQNMTDSAARKRSGAYPLELAHRIINMYSMKEDLVLDPFLGTGTTLNACILNNRRCIGYEIDDTFRPVIFTNAENFSRTVEGLIKQRYGNHEQFIESYIERKGRPKYTNEHHGFPVVTSQETQLLLETLDEMKIEGNEISCTYRRYEPSGQNNIGPLFTDR